MKIRLFSLLSAFLLWGFTHAINAQNKGQTDSLLHHTIIQYTNNIINSPFFNKLTGYHKRDSTTIDRITVNTETNSLHIYYNTRLAYAPFRESSVTIFKDSLRLYIPEVYNKYNLNLYADSILFEELIPNRFRSEKSIYDQERIPQKTEKEKVPVITNISKPYKVSNGLFKRNIALWHSHGWYYEVDLHRWEWQRARLFQTVEDLYPMAYTLPFLVPMLENAGAYVFLPRERDWQLNEVIVDNDGSQLSSVYEENVKDEFSSDANTGFAIGNPPYKFENPFKLGTYAGFYADKRGKQKISWIPQIPENGMYAVYISYKAGEVNVKDAHYTVFHQGGKTEFLVNQQIGGSSWYYLGKFKFKKGVNPDKGKVVLSSKSGSPAKLITADAVRFGGGMGNIERNGLVSNRPRYHEGARYYLQYAGFPDTLVWKLSDSVVNDYTDDYQSRGEWVSYLIGAPSGPTNNRNAKGLGIPIDLSLAFHTDAGITQNDSVIGTLAIYSTKHDSTNFPSGLSKMASRDLSDIIQSQIVNDIRIKYDSNWVRRGLWDRPYSEAYRPMVPAMLLELFSHQNFIDVQFGAEPQFRFDVSRSIYKGMLKFLAVQHDFEYVVQPLPVSHFNIHLDKKDRIHLSWKAQKDPLEPTANADKFIVYTRIDDNDFDNGQLVDRNEFTIKKYDHGKIYSFKVTALNNGGESFPSEILSVCLLKKEKGRVLIVNGFDRTGGPAAINQGNFAGFMDVIDQGVPYRVDISTTGAQYDFDKNSPWLDDDSPGHGASFSNKESLIIPGNTFDFTTIHGQAIKNAGYSFVSVSDEAFIENKSDFKDFVVIDYLTGEEKTSHFPKDSVNRYFEVYPEGLLEKLAKYLNEGGNLFISGAHIGTDIKNNGLEKEVGALLKFKWRTNHASIMGDFYPVDNSFMDEKAYFHFNTGYHPEIYTVEASDAIEPADSVGKTIIRYRENNMSAAISWEGDYKVVAFGFPFEAIVDEAQRNSLMKNALHFLHQ